MTHTPHVPIRGRDRIPSDIRGNRKRHAHRRRTMALSGFNEKLPLHFPPPTSLLPRPAEFSHRPQCSRSPLREQRDEEHPFRGPAPEVRPPPYRIHRPDNPEPATHEYEYEPAIRGSSHTRLIISRRTSPFSGPPLTSHIKNPTSDISHHSSHFSHPRLKPTRSEPNPLRGVTCADYA